MLIFALILNCLNSNEILGSNNYECVTYKDSIKPAAEKGLKLKDKVTISIDYKKISLFETDGRKLIFSSGY